MSLVWTLPPKPGAAAYLKELIRCHGLPREYNGIGLEITNAFEAGERAAKIRPTTDREYRTQLLILEKIEDITL